MNQFFFKITWAVFVDVKTKGKNNMKAKYPVWIYVKFIISASKYVEDILLSSAYMIRWRHEYVNVIKPNILLSKNNGPDGFTKEEMGGISDSFSFVSDENDKSIKKNYNFIDENVENDESLKLPNIILTNDNQQEQLNHMIEERKKQDRDLVENDEIDDLIDNAYNGVNNANRAIGHGDIRRPDATGKKPTTVTQKKINIGISGYRFRQFNR